MTDLPKLDRGQSITARFDVGVGYELENGEVLLIALCSGTDERVYGKDKARQMAIDRAFALLPSGYEQPEPYTDWESLLSAGCFGVGRQYIAKKLEAAPTL